MLNMVNRSASSTGEQQSAVVLRPLADGRVSRSETLARHVEAEVLEQSVPPGTRLGTKRELLERFHVSPSTLNEALRLLEMRSLVELRRGPGGGVFVASPSPKVKLSHLILGFRGATSTIADALAVRNALEPLVAADAGRHHRRADLSELEAILDEMERHAENPAGFLSANWALHRRMVQISPNVLLRSVYTTLLDYVESELGEVESDATFRASQNVEAHRKLVAAIASRSPDAIEAAVREHAPLTEPG